MALVVTSALVVTACGSTVGGVGGVARQGAGLSGEGALGASGAGPGVTDEDLVAGIPEAASGDADGGASGGGRAAETPDGVGTSPTTESPAGAAPGATPETATAQPLQIGVLITDTEAFKSASGVGESGSALTRDSIHAHIEAINAAGGVAGRTLTIVDDSINYSAASYSAEFQAACAKFTEDNHVGAVIYDGIVYNESFNACLTKAGVPAFYMGAAGTQVGDSTDLANHPGLITAGSVNLDRRFRSILHKAIANGFLRSGSKLGVLVESCPYHVRAYDRTIAPIVARNEITVFRTDTDCGAGSADQGKTIAAVESAVLRFKTQGVDSVTFVTNYENGVWFYFASAAEQQQYRPQYLLFTPLGCCLAAGRDAGLEGQFAGLTGFGGLPLWTVTDPPSPPAAQAAAREACLSTATRQGVPTSSLDQEVIVLDTCDTVNLLRRALTLSDGQSGTRHLVSALEQLGTDFVSTITLDGVTRFGPGRHDGMELTAVSVYQAECDCVAYITQPSPIQ